MICLLNGQRTVEQAWEIVGERLGDDQPTQDETLRLLSQLHAADLLLGELPPDLDELARRSDRKRRQDILMRLRSPLALRFPLIDPEKFLRATAPLVAPLYTPVGFILWLVVVAWGVALAAIHWPELTHNLADRVLAGENLLLMALVYPVIKAVHEFGHAYAAKRWGGEVHEMGIFLLVLMPVPYVDASTSAAFRSKWRRATVGGAGIMVEMLIAALAMMVWAHVEPGTVRAIAFNAMLIGGVSTVLFNGNPLLRFDGYYVLCDLVGIPNLGPRSNRYIFYLLKRYLLRITDAESPVTARGEHAWFIGYGVASFVYRVVIMYGIALFLAGKFLVVGVLLAIWAAISVFVVPLGKCVKFLATSPQLHGKRGRALGVTLAATMLVVTPFLLVPVPYATMSEGVLWLPERSFVRAQNEGFVKAVLATPYNRVEQGDPLVALEDPTLAARVKVLEATRRELELRLEAAALIDRVQADMIREQIRHTDASLEVEHQRAREMIVRAPQAGRLVMVASRDLPGRFVRRGALLGYVIGEGEPLVRVVVEQDDVDSVRERTRGVDVRFVEAPENVVPAVIRREVPAASDQLPGAVFSTAGGGVQEVDPSQPERLRPLESIFEFDLGIERPLPTDTVGGRVFVRFDHGSETLAWQLMRAVRQLFLRQFDV